MTTSFPRQPVLRQRTHPHAHTHTLYDLPGQWQLPGVASPPSTASSPTSVSAPRIGRRRDIRAPTTQPPASRIPSSHRAVHCHETTPAEEVSTRSEREGVGPRASSGPTNSTAHVRCRSVGHAWSISTAPAYAKPRDTLHVGRCESGALSQVISSDYRLSEEETR